MEFSFDPRLLLTYLSDYISDQSSEVGAKAITSWCVTVGPCIVRPKYPKKGAHYAKPHYVKPHYTSAWIV